MAFDLKDDMDAVFLDSGFEEPASYIVYHATTPVTKPISAVIFRGTENRINLNIRQSGGDIARKYQSEAYVSRTDIPAVQVNADKFLCKKFPGDAANTTFNVAGIVRMDEGGFRVGLA
jgi:hypothetical protein